MVSPKANIPQSGVQGHEVQRLANTDLGRQAKEAQSMPKHFQGHSHHAALKHPVVRHNNLYMVSPKTNIPQSGVT